jgi:hypothetical protein
MADKDATIPLKMPTDEADAFARFLKRCTYTDCAARSNRVRKYSGRDETDVMWAALRMVESQFAEAGFSPR